MHVGSSPTVRTNFYHFQNKEIVISMSHHYGEYWSRWSDDPKPSEPKSDLFDEIKLFLLTLNESPEAAELVEKIEHHKQNVQRS